MNNRRRFNFPRRQKSLDYELSEFDHLKSDRMPPRCLKYVDENDSTDNLTERTSSLKEKGDKSVRIKMAAIYDDKVEIVRILSGETNMESVQGLLSMQDERGQSCIFYALESRSRKALAYLLEQVKNTECVIAANGESLLHMATKMGEIDILKGLLQHESVGDLVDHVENVNGRAPLHLAAKFNHVEIAKELLLHGAKLTRQDVTGKTPIFMAASKGHAALLEVFLQHGQTSSGHESIESLILNPRLYGKNYDNLLQVAVDSGDEETVHVCLDKDQEIIRKCFKEEIKHGEGGLIHSACQNGMKQCLLKIVDCMRDLEKLHLNRRDRHGFTPLHKAAVNNHVQVVKYLGSISRYFVNQTTEYSQTALVLAAERGHINVVKELLNLKADFEISDDSGRTVLHYAIDFPAILKILLKKKDLVQLLINAKEKDGYTPVHKAALKGLCESLKILLENGGELNVFTNTSRSPLHCAVSSQCVDVVQLVLSNEPALVNKADATGKTPLHTAASYGSAEVVRCLLDYGALVLSDGNMYTALHIAAHKGHLEVVELLVAFNGRIIDWKNKYGRTALIAAASTGKTDVVKFLLENGAAITEDHEFLNCLDWCLIKNDKETAMAMMLHHRWAEILVTTRHGAEGTMAKLVKKMPDVAYRALSNSASSQGNPDTKEYVKRYDFLSLQSYSQDDQKSGKVKPMTAIKMMVTTRCYRCLCHPVCCKFLKAKWMEFGWKLHILSLSLYIIFLVALNIYAFEIPSYEETQGATVNMDASLDVKVAMVICLIFAGVNALKEIIQLIFYRHRYFLDPVNYLEWVLYVCVFIFATPKDGKVAVKTNHQWEACSVALLLAWINLVLYLRRFASYGIYVLMMKRICVTLIKVLSLLIFFFFAFAAAFTSIMNDKQGFRNFGQSVLASAVMTMGEFEFKETFLEETNKRYETFHWLRLTLLVAFLVLMPIILMNLLLALAIDDTSSIMQQAKLTKHVQTAKMIIDLERKRNMFPWGAKSKMVPVLEERPNKRVHFTNTMWAYLFYGPDFTDDEAMETRDQPYAKHNGEQKFAVMMDMMTEIREQISMMQQRMSEMQNGATAPEKSSHLSRETADSVNGKRHAWTQFRGHSESFEDNISDAHNLGFQRKRSAWTQYRRSLKESIPQSSTKEDDAGDVFTEEQDVKDEEEREKSEVDPELVELKELHKKMPVDDDEYDDASNDDSPAEGIGSKFSKLFQFSVDIPDEDASENKV